MDRVLDTIERNRESHVGELVELLRFPSVSADPAWREEVAACGRHLRDRLAAMGLEAELHPTAGHPIVTARYTHPANTRTILVYGHYDVQPADPLELWVSPPFTPRIEGETVYARGAADDKGQLLVHVLAAHAFLAAGERIPVNLIFLLEGEEESGSPNLEPFLRRERARLAADGVVVSDTAMLGPGRPAITVGLRGCAAADIEVTGPARDLHSGSFGGAVANPAAALCRLVASLHDGQGRVAIPGFYDAVRPLEAWEREAWARLPITEEEILAAAGAPALAGEPGFTVLERRWARPTCEVNGLTSGYQGEGGKTIIPARARAKLSLRLVPDQDPRAVLDALGRFLRASAPPGVAVEVVPHGGAPATLVARDSFLIAAAEEAVAAAFGVKPVLIREGGSIPVVGLFRQVLGLESLLLGFAQPDDNAHSPNERFSLVDFQRGIGTAVRLFRLLAGA